MATAQQPAPPRAIPTVRKGVPPLRAAQGNEFFFRKLHSLSASSPSAPSSSSTSSPTSKPSTAPSPTPSRSSSSTPCPSSASSSGPSSSSPSPSTPSTESSSPPRPRPTSTLPLGRQLDVHSPSASPASSPSSTSSSTSGASASCGVSAPRAPRRSLRQGPARTRQPLDARHLRHRHDRHLLALRLRHLALRRQVGHHPRRSARKRFGYVCAVFGLALCLMGLASIYAFVGRTTNAPEDVMPDAASRFSPCSNSPAERASLTQRRQSK